MGAGRTLRQWKSVMKVKMIKIISYSDKYKEEVIALILNIWEDEFGFRNFKRPDIYTIPATYQKDKKSNFWIALNKGKVIGTIALRNKTNGKGFLRRMAVIKSKRRSGLGEKLLKTLLKFAKKHGYKKIYAGMYFNNTAAVNFYTKHGFKKNKILPKDIVSVGASVSDSICLRLDL